MKEKQKEEELKRLLAERKNKAKEQPKPKEQPKEEVSKVSEPTELFPAIKKNSKFSQNDINEFKDQAKEILKFEQQLAAKELPVEEEKVSVKTEEFKVGGLFTSKAETVETQPKISSKPVLDEDEVAKRKAKLIAQREAMLAKKK